MEVGGGKDGGDGGSGKDMCISLIPGNVGRMMIFFEARDAEEDEETDDEDDEETDEEDEDEGDWVSMGVCFFRSTAVCCV